MPHVVCRRCKFRMDLLTVIDDERAKEALTAALKLPPQIGDAVQEYLTLFDTDTRGLTWGRYGAILTALLEDLGRGMVIWKKSSRPAPVALWIECMTQMAAKEWEPGDLPLKNHNYLRSMVYRKADAVEAQAERQREEQRRTDPVKARREQHGQAPEAKATEGAPKPVAELMAEAKAKLRGGLKSPPPTGEG
jgi:hypothetical protein